MSETRYQFQPWYVRWGRWWRWTPYCYALACCRVAWWAIKGAKPISDEDTRRASLDVIWHCTIADADIGMQHYYTFDEVRRELGLPVEDAP